MYRVEVNDPHHREGDGDWAPVFNLCLSNERYKRFRFMNSLLDGEFECHHKDTALDFAAEMASEFSGKTYRVIKHEVEPTITAVAYVSFNYRK